MPSKHAGNIKYATKRLENKLGLCHEGSRIAINLIIAILKHDRNGKFDVISVWSISVSLMNTKSGIFIHSFATHENNAFGVHWGK